MVANALDSQQILRAFVVGGERMKRYFRCCASFQHTLDAEK
ncbi:hypothetical protein [Pectobacterium sp. B2J-2]